MPDRRPYVPRAFQEEHCRNRGGLTRHCLRQRTTPRPLSACHRGQLHQCEPPVRFGFEAHVENVRDLSPLRHRRRGDAAGSGGPARRMAYCSRTNTIDGHNKCSWERQSEQETCQPGLSQRRESDPHNVVYRDVTAPVSRPRVSRPLRAPSGPSCCCNVTPRPARQRNGRIRRAPSAW